MAIVKNNTFKGSAVYDVDAGAPTLARAIRNAQGDVAGTLEHLTDNTNPVHINHSGGSRGALLGIPWVSQLVDYDLTLDAGGGKDGGDTGTPQMFPYLVRVPPGETSIVVEVSANLVNIAVTNPRVRVSLQTNFTSPGSSLGLEFPLVVTQARTRDEIDANAPTRFRASITGLLADSLLLTLMFDAGSFSGATISDIVIRPDRNPQSVTIPIPASVNAAGVVAPTSTQALFHQAMDDSIFVDGEGMTGWHTSRLDRNINGLLEFATGSPAGKNATYTHTESVLRLPTRDRFGAFTRRTFSAEPIPVIPICSINFGGIKPDGYLVDINNPTSIATRKSYAPMSTSAAVADVAIQSMHMPDLPTSPSVLRWAVLLGQSDTAAFGWPNIRCEVQIEGAAVSASVTPTALTGAPRFALAQGSALGFSRDGPGNRLRVRPSQVAGVFSPFNYCVLAAAVWIEE